MSRPQRRARGLPGSSPRALSGACIVTAGDDEPVKETKMGALFRFACPDCGYEAEASGGVDVGMMSVTHTVRR